jgi:protein TonB
MDVLMGLAARTLLAVKSAAGVRAAIVLSVALHGTVVVSVGSRPAGRAIEPAPVEQQPDVLYVIAELPTEPKKPDPPPPVDAPRPPVRAQAPRAVAAKHAPSPPAPIAEPPGVPAPPTLAADEGTADNSASTASASSSVGASPAGTGTAAPAPAPADQGVDLAGYGRAIQSRILSNLHYPEHARRKRVEAVVLVEISIDGRGSLVRARIVGDAPELLRDAALDAVTKAAPFPATPHGGPIGMQVPLRFSMRQ